MSPKVYIGICVFVALHFRNTKTRDAPVDVSSSCLENQKRINYVVYWSDFPLFGVGSNVCADTNGEGKGYVEPKIPGDSLMICCSLWEKERNKVWTSSLLFQPI